MVTASRTATAPRPAKLSAEVRRTLALAALALAATAGGIGITALAFSGSGAQTPAAEDVGDQYFSPAQNAGTKDIWYLEKRGPGDRIRDGHDRK